MIHPGIDKVIALLREAGEERFDMGVGCGTPCCIGGHCNLQLTREGYSKRDLQYALAQIAEISATDAVALCYPTKEF